jgi:hypothetical protein
MHMELGSAIIVFLMRWPAVYGDNHIAFGCVVALRSSFVDETAFSHAVTFTRACSPHTRRPWPSIGCCIGICGQDEVGIPIHLVHTCFAKPDIALII